MRTVTRYSDTVTEPLSDDATLDLVNSRLKHSRNAFSTLHRKVGRWYDLYRGVYRGDFDAHRNFVTLPLIFSTVQSDVARKMNTLFSIWPYVGMFGYGPEDAAAARKNELLISAQMKDCSTYLKGYDFALQADLYGTGLLQHGWRYDEEKLLVREQMAAPMTRRMVERISTDTTVVFDGPDWEVVDILDAFPQPGYHDLTDMGWFIRRQWMDLDEIRALVKAGIYKESGLRKLELYGAVQDVEAAMVERRGYVRHPVSSYPNEPVRTEKFAKPVEIIEMWGQVPDEMIPSDGGTERVITIANQRCILRNEPNPFWHGRKPFLNYCPMRDPHDFFGIGKAEVSEKLQVTANKIACQKLDALDLFIDPMFYVNRNAGIDQRRMKTKPGGIIMGDAPPTEALQAIIPNLSGVQNAYQEIQDVWRWMQQATGIVEDTVMGIGSSKRTTAREFMGRQESVSVRLLLEARLAEEMWVEPLAQSFRALNRQFLTTPKTLKILGMNAQVDPITGMPVAPEMTPVQMDDLYQDYDVRAMGTTQAMGKQERLQRLLMIYQMAAANPIAMQAINHAAFLREIFLASELYNTTELLTPPPSQMMMQQPGMPGMTGTAGPPPADQGEGGGGPPVNLAAGLTGLPPLPPAGGGGGGMAGMNG